MSELSKVKGQFLLSQDTQFFIDHWVQQKINSWVLATHPSLFVRNICTKNNEHVGWLLGYPITTIEDEGFVNGALYFDVNSSEELTHIIIESKLYRFSGRFVAIVIAKNFARLYLDASGSMGVVYSSQYTVAASTTALLQDHIEPCNDAMLTLLQSARTQSGTWHPCGLTELSGVRVVLPNHFLDLTNWTVQRHYPVECIQRTSSLKTARQTTAEIVQILTHNIGAVAADHLLHLNLTAGRDTRMLLACSHNFLDRITFITAVQDIQHVDAVVAQAMAEVFDLDYRLNEPFLANRVILTGFAGEVGRAFYWRSGDEAKTKLTADDLLVRLKYPRAPILLEELDRWLSEIKFLDVFEVLDLLYIEQRLGCCMGFVMYSYDEISVFSLYPMNQRKIFELMRQLPVEYRISQKFAEDVCIVAWPELLEFPFNAPHFTGWTRYFRLIRQYSRFIVKKLTGKSTIKQKILLDFVSRDKQWLQNLYLSKQPTE